MKTMRFLGFLFVVAYIVMTLGAVATDVFK